METEDPAAQDMETEITAGSDAISSDVAMGGGGEERDGFELEPLQGAIGAADQCWGDCMFFFMKAAGLGSA
jgi:hypothetical protein